MLLTKMLQGLCLPSLWLVEQGEDLDKLALMGLEVLALLRRVLSQSNQVLTIRGRLRGISIQARQNDISKHVHTCAAYS